MLALEQTSIISWASQIKLVLDYVTWSDFSWMLLWTKPFMMYHKVKKHCCHTILMITATFCNSNSKTEGPGFIVLLMIYHRNAHRPYLPIYRNSYQSLSIHKAYTNWFKCAIFYSPQQFHKGGTFVLTLKIAHQNSERLGNLCFCHWNPRCLVTSRMSLWRV